MSALPADEPDDETEAAYAAAAEAGVIIDRHRPLQPIKTALCADLQRQGLLGQVCTQILNAHAEAARQHHVVPESTVADLRAISRTVKPRAPEDRSLPCAYCGDEVRGGLVMGARLRWCSGPCLRAWRAERG